jgi:hypothetical protein
MERAKQIGMLQCHPKVCAHSYSVSLSLSVAHWVQVLSVVEAGHTVQESLHLRLLPMLIQPKPWLTPNFGGYLSINTSVMRSKGSHAQLELLHECETSQVFEVPYLPLSLSWCVSLIAVSVGSGLAVVHALGRQPLRAQGHARGMGAGWRYG